MSVDGDSRAAIGVTPLAEEPAPQCWPMEPLVLARHELWLRKWITYWHGEGEPHQADAYRCGGCGRLITWKLIRAGGVCICGAAEMRPTNLSLMEKLRFIFLPWTMRHE